jgi:excisionase family DNA binding protein
LSPRAERYIAAWRGVSHNARYARHATLSGRFRPLEVYYRVALPADQMDSSTVTFGSSEGGDRLLTAAEVALLLRVTPAWVYSETRQRRIPHLRLGRYVRYRQSALELWLAEVEQSSSAIRTARRR